MSFHQASTNYQNFLAGQSDGHTALHSENEHHSFSDQLGNTAKPGDILEFLRGPYTHYALYLGQGKVMSIDMEENGGANDCANIQQRDLSEACNGNKVVVRNHENIAKSLFNLTARNTQDIIQSAKSFEDKLVPYEFDFRNCEYYCTLWRYGKGFSVLAAKYESGAGDAKPTAHPTSADYFVDDGYAKYKQLAENRQDAYDNNLH